MDPKTIREKIMERVKSLAPENVTPETMDQLVENLSKATEKEVREILNEIPIHEDLYYDNNPNSVPGSNVIRMGPQESASGNGAEHMIRQYSNVAPQGDGHISELYGRMSRELDHLRKSLITDLSNMVKTDKSVVKAIALLTESFRTQNAVLTSILKAQEEETEKGKKKSEKKGEEEEEEETEKSRALQYLRKAKSFIIKAEMSDLEDGKNSAEYLQKADLYLKKAKTLLLKAEELAMTDEEEESVEKALETLKAFSVRLSKARRFVKSLKVVKGEEEEDDEEEEDEEEEEEEEEAAVVNINQGAEEEEDEEEEEEEDEEEKAKKAKKTKKAKRPATGNQKDSANKDGNQKDGAVKSGDLQTIVSRTVYEVLDMIGNASRGKVSPNMSKATVESFLVSKSQEIEEAVENDEMTDSEAINAQSILNTIQLSKSGDIGQEVVTERLAVAPASVQRLFGYRNR
jgi:hypothetical protein